MKQWWTPPTISVPVAAASCGANTDKSTAAATSNSASAMPPRFARCRANSFRSNARRMYQRMRSHTGSGREKSDTSARALHARAVVNLSPQLEASHGERKRSGVEDGAGERQGRRQVQAQVQQVLRRRLVEEARA